jgi:DNA-directed RNA polymerase subunit beta
VPRSARRNRLVRYPQQERQGAGAKKRITARHVKLIEEAGVAALKYPTSLVGRIIARTVVDKESGEVLAEQCQLTDELLETLRDKGVRRSTSCTSTIWTDRISPAP